MERDPKIEHLLDTLFPRARAAQKEGMCPFCRKPVCMKDFKDDLSRKEFTITGLCQKCQDSFYN